MSRFPRSLPQAYFDDLYARDADPWQFATSPYERRKYAATLAALPSPRFQRALEVGCSIGVLTRQLAARCEHLLALDISAAAVTQAQARCAGLANVRFAQQQVPADWPDGSFDLILLSEVVYYLDAEDVRQLAARTDAAAMSNATILLVHWLGETHYPLTGDEATETFLQASSARRVGGQRTPEYRLDLLRATA